MDAETCARRIEVPTDTFIDLTQLFISSTRASIARMKTALGSGDNSAIAAAAHEVKGAALSLGFDLAAELSERMETDARRGGTVSAETLSRLEERVDTLEHAIIGPITPE